MPDKLPKHAKAGHHKDGRASSMSKGDWKKVQRLQEDALKRRQAREGAREGKPAVCDAG
jgi:hypothetical protein